MTGDSPQYEMVTGPLPPLQAADTLVFTRETIYNIANKHGFRATFSPKLQTDERKRTYASLRNFSR